MNNLSLIQEAAIFGGDDGTLDFGPIVMHWWQSLGGYWLAIPSYGEEWHFARFGDMFDFACAVARNA